MSFRRYTVVNGRMIAQQLTDGTRVGFMHDALGSVVGTVTSAGAVAKTYRYKPHGPTTRRSQPLLNPSQVPSPPGQAETQYYMTPSDPCALLSTAGKCEGSMVFCIPRRAGGQTPGWLGAGDLCAAFLHELIHVAGLGGSAYHNTPGALHVDFIYAMGCCLGTVLFPGQRISQCRGFNILGVIEGVRW